MTAKVFRPRYEDAEVVLNEFLKENPYVSIKHFATLGTGENKELYILYTGHLGKKEKKGVLK